MKITEISVVVADDHIQKRDGVLAFAKIIFDNTFCVRDIKVMHHTGCIFLGMPARKKTQPCPGPGCRSKVFFSDSFCSSCGHKLSLSRPEKPYGDVAYPITSQFRRYLEERIMEVYNGQVEDPDKLRVRDR